MLIALFPKEYKNMNGVIQCKIIVAIVDGPTKSTRFRLLWMKHIITTAKRISENFLSYSCLYLLRATSI